MSVTVLSWLFIVQGNPCGRFSDPSTQPCRGPRLRALRSSAAFRDLRPLHPALRANPFPEVTDLFCRLPLSTLFYVTRGYTPWRPDAVISTPGGANKVSGSDFQGPWAAHRTDRKPVCFPSRITLSPGKPIPGWGRLLTRKENSSRGCL